MYSLSIAVYGVTLGSTAVNFPPPASLLSEVSMIEIESAALTKQMAQSMLEENTLYSYYLHVHPLTIKICFLVQRSSVLQ